MSNPRLLGTLAFPRPLLHAPTMGNPPKLPAAEEQYLEGLVAEFRRRDSAARKKLIDESARKLLVMRQILEPTPVTEQYSLLVELFYSVCHLCCRVGI